MFFINVGKMKKILIADDNVQIVNVLKQYAVNENYEVYTADDGEKTLEEFEKRTYDAVLLDVMMPKVDGFEICRYIRKKSMVPIIMITARGEDYNCIMGLDIGADDYVVKPFSPVEVMARLRAVFRRMNLSSQEVLEKGSLKIFLNKNETFIKEKKISLTRKEMEILWLLAFSPEVVFSRNQILDMVWGKDYFGDNRTVDTHIRRLRAKLEQFEHEDWDVTTVRGVGYKFEVADE